MRTSAAALQLTMALVLSITILAPLMLGAVGSSATSSSTVRSSNGAPQTYMPSDITPWKPRPILGGQKTIVLLVQFRDVRFRSSISDVRALVDNVDKWFRKSSYGKMYINYTIHEEILTLPKPMSSYGTPNAADERGDDPDRADAYITDALNLVISRTNVNLHNYKHIVLIHAGGDEANTGNPNELWSYCDCVGPIADENPAREASWVLYDESGRITHAFWGVSTFSEDESWAVFVHEYTHSLGVTDLYVYGSDGYSEGPGVGFWSNMASGAFLDPPADIDGWSKYILGWIQVISLDSPKGEYTIHTLDSSQEPKALLMTIQGNEDEYYFLHARRKADIDAALPSEGVIAFKINRLRERSLKGEELALMSDANPTTPPECDQYARTARELCRPVDAPYNAKGRNYRFTYHSMSVNILLNQDGFWDGDARIAFKIQPVADDAFKITLGGSPEEIGLTATTTTSTTGTTQTETPTCVIATAALGSDTSYEVAYMRFVRDGLIGSSQAGKILVNAFNAFYYSWSPAMAKTVASSWTLRALFRILLLPLVWTVHVTALSFATVAALSGSADIASVFAFLIAAYMCVAFYLASPALVATKMARRIRRLHFNS